MFALLPQSTKRHFARNIWIFYLQSTLLYQLTSMFFKHCGVLKDNDRPEGKCIQLYVLIFINQNILKAYDKNEINFTY